MCEKGGPGDSVLSGLPSAHSSRKTGCRNCCHPSLSSYRNGGVLPAAWGSHPDREALGRHRERGSEDRGAPSFVSFPRFGGCLQSTEQSGLSESQRARPCPRRDSLRPLRDLGLVSARFLLSDEPLAR